LEANRKYTLKISAARPDPRLPGVAHLASELVDERAVAFVGGDNESLVDAIQNLRPPNGSVGEQQRAVAQEAVGPECTSRLVELRCVVF
jgi:hypothetical protein